MQGIDQDDISLGIDEYSKVIFDGKALDKNEQQSVPFRASCCSRGTQKHEPWNHSDMIFLLELCKADIHQDDSAGGKDVDMLVVSPFGKEDHNIHRIRLFHAVPMMKTQS